MITVAVPDNDTLFVCDIYNWLEENVGPALDSFEGRIGWHGKNWTIRWRMNSETNFYLQVELPDETTATLFTLRWL